MIPPPAVAPLPNIACIHPDKQTHRHLRLLLLDYLIRPINKGLEAKLKSGIRAQPSAVDVEQGRDWAHGQGDEGEKTISPT